MFKKVIWATDGSEGADQAMPLARALAAEGGGELLAVHCEEIMMPVRGTAGLSFAPNEDDLQAKIRQQVAELSQDGVTTTLQMTKRISGGAAHAIADVARDERADLIVVGTRGHTVLGGLLVGSVTQRLLHIAPCPVLAVPKKGGQASD